MRTKKEQHIIKTFLGDRPNATSESVAVSGGGNHIVHIYMDALSDIRNKFVQSFRWKMGHATF
jgi:hypothetical protein